MNHVRNHYAWCNFEQTMNGIDFTSNHHEANVTVSEKTDQPCLRAVGFEEVFELRMNFCPVCGVVFPQATPQKAKHTDRHFVSLEMTEEEILSRIQAVTKEVE